MGVNLPKSPAATADVVASAGGTRSANLAADHAADEAEKGCNKIRRISQVSRMACAAKNIGFDINSKILKWDILETHSNYVARMA